MAKTLTLTVSPSTGTNIKSLTVNVSPVGSVVGARKTLQVNVSPVGSVPPVQKSLTLIVRVPGPTLIAGPNLVAEAGQKLTVTPQKEQAGSASITAREWRQDGIVISTTASCQPVMPVSRVGANVVLSYKVTDANGAIVTDQLTVVVMPSAVRGVGGAAFIERAGS
jgi:hypothetical protein